MNFDQAFERLIGHEGGFTENYRDKGNWTGGMIGKGTLQGTKFGISAASYPLEDIRNLTLSRAKELYRRDYWGPCGIDALPDVVRFSVFDMAVNSGMRNTIKALQKATGELEDGVLGPRTLQAIQSMPPLRLAARFNGARLKFMASSKDWDTFSEGWAVRVAENLLEV